MPWAAWNELRRRICLPYIRLVFALNGVRWGRNWRIFGAPVIQRYRGSSIELGDELELRSWRTSNPLTPRQPVVLATRTPGARIHVGRRVGMTGATLVASDCIEIGDRVALGANAVIVDCDFHPLDPEARRNTPQAGESRPVVIEHDVFIGMYTLVLKGAHIGVGSVIGAGSVVTGEIPPGVVAAGNPARVLRTIHA